MSVIFRLFAALVISTILLSMLSAFHVHRTRINPADLNSTVPFGFNWDSYSGEGIMIGDGHWKKCRNLVSKLETIIASEHKEHFVNLCAQNRHTTIFISRQNLPSAFRRGQLSVVYRGASEPVSYNYSYLHRLLSIGRDLHATRRKQHAKKLQEQLTSLYGAPKAYGSYDQDSYTGFVASDDDSSACQLWLADEVGIVLCAERIVLIDEIEMSLNFIRLDRVNDTRLVKCFTALLPQEDCKFEDESDSDIPFKDSAGYLDIMADWLDPENFSQCKSETLEPIEQRMALPAATELKLASVLEAYSGDELMQYVISYSGEDDENVSRDEKEKIMLFLVARAAQQGSAAAMNELGASLFYCGLNVQQDVNAARGWYDKAIAGGDYYAMKSLAHMYLLGIVDEVNSNESALRLLQECADVDEEYCARPLYSLREILSVSESLDQ